MNIEGVVLAGGFSSRAGAFKMAWDIGGKSVIERCIEGMIDYCSRIIVVGGYRNEKIEELLSAYPKIETIFNQRYAEGMFTSVKAGVGHIRGERFFLTPGDYPLINPAVCQRLLDVDDQIVIPTFGGRKGHPILMTAHLAQELNQADDRSNLRSFINHHGYRTVEVDNEGILFDIDTPEDYRQVIGRLQGGRSR